MPSDIEPAMAPVRLPEPGDIGHWLVTGFTYMRNHRESSGAVSVRGEEFTVTEAMIEANRDNEGKCFLDALHAPTAPDRMGARRLVAPGPWDDSQERTEAGTVEHADARQEALDVARQIADKDERAEAMREVRERFGPAPVTSTTLADYRR